MKPQSRLSVAVDPSMTLGVMLDRLAPLRPGWRLATELGAEALDLSFEDAAELSSKWSGALRTRIAAGERVVLALPNGYAMFLASIAVARAGGVVIPVNPRMRGSEIDHVIADSQARLVIETTNELDVDGARAGMRDAVPADPDDVAAIFYSSGTTGKPLGAQLTHRSLTGLIRMLALNPMHRQRGEAVSGLPVAHISGFSMLVMMAGMGVPICLLPKFNPVHALDAIEQRRATMFVGVPSMYRMMVEAGAAQRDLSSVRMWASGADLMPVEIANAFRRFGGALRVPGTRRSIGAAAFVDGYGSVESGGAAAIRVAFPGPTTSNDRMLTFPRPGYKLRVLGADGAQVPVGEVGEFAIKGGAVMRGYHGDADATRQVMTADGWLKTGDLARRRRFGVAELVGRKKDVIKHGGYSVFAAEVEAALEEHPHVAEAAVIGLPDAVKGEVPVAVLRPSAGTNPSTDEILAFMSSRVSDYKAPKALRFVDSLPRNGTGKVRKAELIDLFEQ